MSKQCFTLPWSPYLMASDFNKIYLPFLNKYKDWIHDIYVTARVKPFGQDAMGMDIGDDNATKMIRNALFIQKETGIPVCTTFNNIHVQPSYRNYKIFVNHFAELYQAGVRLAIIPHMLWLDYGLKKEFPELKVKNTILRKVYDAQVYVDYARYGFDFVHLDRWIMRDQKKLKEIVKAKKFVKEEWGKDCKLILLANEGCVGRCPIMDEHYAFNNMKLPSEDPFFWGEAKSYACVSWEKQDPAYYYKEANIPWFKSDWDEFLDLGVVIFKMHGRENVPKLIESMELIKSFVKGEEDMVVERQREHSTEPFYTEFQANPENREEVDKWRKIIKNCRFQCWSCNYCDKVQTKVTGVKPDRSTFWYGGNKEEIGNINTEAVLEDMEV